MSQQPMEVSAVVLFSIRLVACFKIRKIIMWCRVTANALIEIFHLHIEFWKLKFWAYAVQIMFLKCYIVVCSVFFLLLYNWLWMVELYSVIFICQFLWDKILHRYSLKLDNYWVCILMQKYYALLCKYIRNLFFCFAIVIRLFLSIIFIICLYVELQK